jgi:hypothetical protein
VTAEVIMISYNVLKPSGALHTVTMSWMAVSVSSAGGLAQLQWRVAGLDISPRK